MKTIDTMFVAITLTQLGSCQEIREKNYQLDVEVKDHAGIPVSGAKVITGRLVSAHGGAFPLANPITIESDVTDSSGKIRLSYKSLPEPDGNASVYGKGYYTSSYVFGWNSTGGGEDATRVADIKAILKPVKNPIPMVARKDLRISTPEFGMPYSFDLEMGQALPPFGNGKVADIQFTLSGTRRDLAEPKMEMIDLSSDISCPNEGDGFVEFLVEDTKEFSKGSMLPSSHEAPADGYVAHIARTTATGPRGDLGNVFSVNQTNGKKCYYFRIRTVKNESGKIVSAHYGKMYGPLEIRPAYKQYGHDISKGQGGFFIQYLYFNPTPNDRNVEFDPKRNLNPEGNVQKP